MVFYRLASSADGVVEHSNYDSDGTWRGEGPDPRINFPVTNFNNGPLNSDNRIRRRNPARKARPTHKIKRMG